MLAFISSTGVSLYCTTCPPQSRESTCSAKQVCLFGYLNYSQELGYREKEPYVIVNSNFPKCSYHHHKVTTMSSGALCFSVATANNMAKCNIKKKGFMSVYGPRRDVHDDKGGWRQYKQEAGRSCIHSHTGIRKRENGK